jgi:hypothetical protein
MARGGYSETQMVVGSARLRHKAVSDPAIVQAPAILLQRPGLSSEHLTTNGALYAITCIR